MPIKSDVYSPEHDKYYRNLWVCLFSRFLEAARPQVTYGPASADTICWRKLLRPFSHTNMYSESECLSRTHA